MARTLFFHHSPAHPLVDCLDVIFGLQLIAALQSEVTRLTKRVEETAANLEDLEVKLSEEQGVSKAREDDLEAASEELETAQVFFFFFSFDIGGANRLTNEKPPVSGRRKTEQVLKHHDLGPCARETVCVCVCCCFFVSIDRATRPADQ